MATRPQFQRRGVATAILRELLALADEWGLSTASLYATASGAQLYRDHGFVDIAPATLWERDVIMRSPPRSALSPLTRTSWDAAAALDARLVGVPRHRLLRWLLRDNPGRCFQVSATDGPMLGYVVAQRGRIGPAVATSSDAMTALLDAALSLEFREPVTIIVPAENGVAADLLNERGFAPRRTTWHMMRGATGAHGHPSRMLALASFGLG